MERYKKSKLYWTTLAIIGIYFALMAIYLTTIIPRVQGDGHEYIMQTVSFQNHLSFGANQEDLVRAKEQFYNNKDGLQWLFDNHMVMDKSGWKYNYHFGAYSALVTITKLILLKMNVYPLWAFSITNLLLWMVAVLITFFCLKADDKKKFCIVFLLMFNPIFYYIDWVHTEMYIFAFEVIGLVFLYNKKYALSILTLSISAMQNLGVLPMAAVAGLAYILDCYDKYVFESQDRNIFRFVVSYWKKITPYIAFYLPAFYPIIMTYLRFGTYSLVAKAVMEKKYLFHKAIDYLMDPNLGIFPYEPIILIAFFVLIIIGIKKFTREAALNLIGITGILYIIAHEVQINSGMQGIMRYCVWIIPIMIFFVVFKWQPINKSGIELVVFTIIEGLFTAILIGYCTWFGGGYTSDQFASWTKVLIDKIPWIYNPTHGIFYSRVSGMELYYSADPMVYTNEQGYVRKILLSKEAENVFSGWRIIDDEGNLIDKSGLRGYKIDEGDFTYYNFTGKVKCQAPVLGENIDTIWFYTDDYNADNFVKEGLSIKEDWGQWTEGNRVEMYFDVEDDIPYIDICIDIGDTFYQPQTVIIFINEENIYHNILEGDSDIKFVFKNPKNGSIKLTLLLPDAVAPSKVMESADERILGLALLSMKITAANYETITQG